MHHNVEPTCIDNNVGEANFHFHGRQTTAETIMPSPDIQPMRDTNAEIGNSSFFNDCKEGSRYIVNEVIGKGR